MPDHDVVRRTQPWLSLAASVLTRHDLPADSDMRVAASSQLPVVISGSGHVVKFYGPSDRGHASAQDEARALTLLARDPAIRVPRLDAQGEIDGAWRYIVQSEIGGAPFGTIHEAISEEHRAAAAAAIGRELGRIHAVELGARERDEARSAFEDFIRHRHVFAADELTANRVLPPKLLDGLKAWLPPLHELLAFAPATVPLHADLHEEHVLGRVVDGRFDVTGIIDFDRFRLGHPMYELGPVWGYLLLGRADDLRRFMSAAGIEGVDRADMPRIALAWCLLHAGVAQGPVDVADVDRASTLEELADLTFGQPDQRGTQALGLVA